MSESKYELRDDMDLDRAGFSDQSLYDIKRNEILQEMERYSDKSGREPLLLILSLVAGLHRLTNGKILSGLVFGLTLGGLGIWFIIDWYLIISGKFTDKYGKPISARAVYGLQKQLDELTKRHANGEI